MCFSQDNSAELTAAREQAAAAKRQANLALAAAKKATAQATASTLTPADSEKARDSAEAEMRKRVAAGTYTKNFLPGTAMPRPSIGYSTLLAA